MKNIRRFLVVVVLVGLVSACSAMNSMEINPFGPNYSAKKLLGTDCYKVTRGTESLWLKIYDGRGRIVRGIVELKKGLDEKYRISFQGKTLVFEREEEVIPVYGAYDDLKHDAINHEHVLNCFRFVGQE